MLLLLLLQLLFSLLGDDSMENFDKFSTNLFCSEHKRGANFDRMEAGKVKVNWCNCIPNKVIKSTSNILCEFVFFFLRLCILICLFTIESDALMQQTLYYNYIKSSTFAPYGFVYTKVQFNYVLKIHWIGVHKKFPNSSEQPVNNVIILWFDSGSNNICNRKVSSLPIYISLSLSFAVSRFLSSLRSIALLFCYSVLFSPSFAHTDLAFKLENVIIEARKNKWEKRAISHKYWSSAHTRTRICRRTFPNVQSEIWSEILFGFDLFILSQQHINAMYIDISVCACVRVCLHAEPSGQKFHAYVFGWYALRKIFD